MSTPIDMAEPVRRAEIVPANLRALRDKLRATWQTQNIWDLGDQNHDYGFHRSRAWVLGSRYSRFRAGDYSVQGSLNQGGDSNWVAALDFALPDAQLAQVYARLDPTLRAGRLPQVRELLKEPGHGHLSFYRSRANDDHTLLYQVMTGESPATEEDDVKFTVREPSGTIWLCDFLSRRAIRTVEEWKRLLVWGADGRAGKIVHLGDLPATESIDWYGTRIDDAETIQLTAEQVEALLAEFREELAKQPKPLTEAQTIEASRKGSNLAEDS